MCNLSTALKSKSRIVYKYAAKHIKSGKYYSPCTGIEYKDGPVEIPIVQNAIDTTYIKDILVPRSRFFNENMIGRTTGFLELEQCREEASDHWLKLGYEAVILKVRLSKELMAGYYEYDDQPVIAGKNIEILKELPVEV